MSTATVKEEQRKRERRLAADLLRKVHLATEATMHALRAGVSSLEREFSDCDWEVTLSRHLGPSKDAIPGSKLVPVQPEEIVIRGVGAVEIGRRSVELGHGKVAIGVVVRHHSEPAIGDWTGLELRKVYQPGPDHLLLDAVEGTISIPTVGGSWPCSGPRADGLPVITPEDAEDIVWRLLELTLGLVRVGDSVESNHRAGV